MGLRSSHFDYILQHQPPVDWFEAISENFMDSQGRARDVIRRVSERYPVALHGVSLSIGSVDPLVDEYLTRLRALADEIQARWVSDHLCWTGICGKNSHDLLPLPLNEETLAHVGQRVEQVQEFLSRPLVLENPSTYVSLAETTIEEPEFLRELCQRTGCKLLLDVNNVYVSCFNAARDPWAYLKDFPCDHVVQMHLAGHQHCGTHIVDTHDQPVSEAVWQLFRYAWQRARGVATLLEWDGDVPEFPIVFKEILLAKQHMGKKANPSFSNTSTPLPRHSVPNPVDFLVPRVIERHHLEA